MSHDQKPARVRLVGGGAGSEERRRLPAAPVRNTGDAGAVATRRSAGRSVVLPGLMFIIGCAIGGVVLPLLHIA